MRGECDENQTVNSAPRGLKYSVGHNHDEDLDSVVLVGVVAWQKLLLTMIYRSPGFPLSGPGEIVVRCHALALWYVTLVIADLLTVCWEKYPLSPHLSVGLLGHF